MENFRVRVLEKLSLEDYVRFIGSDKEYDLTCELLKQVIHMHGYRKGKKAKSLLREGLKSIELMEPTRSTLKDENMSGNAFISLEEAVKDLVELKWQECCISSIQMINSSNYNSQSPPADDQAATITTPALATSSSAVKTKRKRPRKMLAAIEDAAAGEGGKVAAMEGGGGSGNGEGEDFGSGESGVCCSGEGGEGQGLGEKTVPVVRKSRKKTLARFVPPTASE